MNALAAVEMALALLQGVTAATSNQVDDVAVDLLQGAVAKLKSVIDQPVTRTQLESLRTKALW